MTARLTLYAVLGAAFTADVLRDIRRGRIVTTRVILLAVLAVYGLAGCTPADAAPTQTAPVSGLIEAAEALEKINAQHGVKLRHAEIDEVAGRIANGAAICCATWRDTEARGWLWYCSLPLGHDGHHRCIGATW